MSAPPKAVWLLIGGLAAAGLAYWLWRRAQREFGTPESSTSGATPSESDALDQVSVIMLDPVEGSTVQIDAYDLLTLDFGAHYRVRFNVENRSTRSVRGTFTWRAEEHHLGWSDTLTTALDPVELPPESAIDVELVARTSDFSHVLGAPNVDAVLSFSGRELAAVNFDLR